MGVLAPREPQRNTAGSAAAQRSTRASSCGEPAGRSPPSTPMKGRPVDAAAPVPVNDPPPSRASLASLARARRGPQKNCPSPAAATTWAILMIRLAVAQFLFPRAYPAGMGTSAAELGICGTGRLPRACAPPRDSATAPPTPTVGLPAGLSATEPAAQTADAAATGSGPRWPRLLR